MASCLRLRRSRTSAAIRIASERTSSTTETDAAAARSSPSIALKMWTEATSVENGMFPEMSTTEPNSPTALPNESAAPERIAGMRFGRTMRRNVVRGFAPSEAAACSISRSSSRSTGWTERTTKGSVTKRSARTIAVRV